MGDDVIIDDPEDAFDLELVPREGERRPLQPNDSLEVDEGEEELDLEEPIDLPPEPSAKMACLRQYGPVWAAVFIIMAFVLVLAFGLGDFTPRTGSAANEETPAVVVSDVAITKSASDTRSYRYLHLAQNSLPVMLIHDPSTEKAAAAMSVGAGSSDDFPQREGLAHFLEHALFMVSRITRKIADDEERRERTDGTQAAAQQGDEREGRHASNVFSHRFSLCLVASFAPSAGQRQVS